MPAKNSNVMSTELLRSVLLTESWQINYEYAIKLFISSFIGKCAKNMCSKLPVPTFLAPRTSLMEDKFSMVQVHGSVFGDPYSKQPWQKKSYLHWKITTIWSILLMNLWNITFIFRHVSGLLHMVNKKERDLSQRVIVFKEVWSSFWSPGFQGLLE